MYSSRRLEPDNGQPVYDNSISDTAWTQTRRPGFVISSVWYMHMEAEMWQPTETLTHPDIQNTPTSTHVL